MPRIEINPELESRLALAARERGCTAAELIASLLESGSDTWRTHPLIAFTLSPDFRARFTDADRYLSLLGWIARHHGAEFSDFLEHAESGRKYIALTPEAIRARCRHNQARQVPETRYWAIMNLDTPTKRRFLRRLLVFLGAPDEVINHCLSMLGKRELRPDRN